MQSDPLMHPVRLRIVMALAGTERTMHQIAAALDDVPTSSVYRHLQVLQQAGVVEVVGERQVRGAVEKTLCLANDTGTIGAAEAGHMTADMFRRTLLAFHAQLLHEFEQYVQNPDSDPARDLIGFRTATLYATDQEWLAVIEAMNAALLPLFEQAPGAGRIRRRLATWTLPLPDVEEEQS